jgi:hypothetical protein
MSNMDDTIGRAREFKTLLDRTRAAAGRFAMRVSVSSFGVSG